MKIRLCVLKDHMRNIAIEIISCIKKIREFSASLLGLKQANVISFPQNDKEGPGSDERKPKTDRSNR